ncbi:hypothetical protein C0Q70_16724 [Pomacea canaliculata]|uniref:Uncharacterized protein n=1 Tax=Pomacea canaliculata TaxID=400727 RepID=A0A2T7NQM5_POMCA|nr:hypothetical protein C0Q70_16724 [Pomacea canaliculata]
MGCIFNTIHDLVVQAENDASSPVQEEDHSAEWTDIILNMSGTPLSIVFGIQQGGRSGGTSHYSQTEVLPALLKGFSDRIIARQPTPHHILVKGPTPRDVSVRRPTPRDVSVRRPTPRHVSVRWPTPRHVSVRWPTPRHVSVRRPTPRDVSVRRPTPRHVSVRWPTPRHVSVRWPTPRHVSVRRPTPRHVSVRRPTPILTGVSMMYLHLHIRIHRDKFQSYVSG